MPTSSVSPSDSIYKVLLITRRYFEILCCVNHFVLLFSLQILSKSFANPWSLAQQASASMGFPKQEYWSELYFLLQAIFPNQGLNPHLLHWQVDSLSLSHQGSHILITVCRLSSNACIYHTTNKTNIRFMAPRFIPESMVLCAWKMLENILLWGGK